MKKIFLLLTVIVLIGSQQQVSAQKKLTEAVLIYDLKLEGGEELGMMAAMIPTEFTMKYKGTKSRTEYATGMSESIMIADAKDSKATIALLDMMGNKYAMKVDEAKMAEQKAKLPIYDVLETKETKLIAGYKCIKAVLINQTTKEEQTVFYTPDIPFIENIFNTELSKLKGMPMEYVSKMSSIKLTVSIREVKKDKVTDDMFSTPADYKVVTQEELMKELGAGE